MYFWESNVSKAIFLGYQIVLKIIGSWMIEGAVECGRVGSVLSKIKSFGSYDFEISDISESFVGVG